MRAASPILLVLLTCEGAALAQPAPDYGFTWRTIGSPGNAPASPADYFNLNAPVGRVDYSYRLTQTEVTNTQFLPFIAAYVQFHPEALFDPGLSGDTIYPTTNDPAHPGWTIAHGAENAAASMSWQYAARLCNWLQNGKANTAAAFDSGVYDVSTFVHNPDGSWSGQATHAPGAQFWIPSYDEWTKGMHFDPNKNGSGPGYWLYPYMSDTVLPGGPPGTPGVYTSAGDYIYSGRRVFPAGSFPFAQSPWGLLDGSGGQSEWLDGSFFDGGDRAEAGASGENMFPFLDDRLDYVRYWPPNIDFGGIRLASTVPAAGTVAGLMPLGLVLLRRRRS